VPVRGFGRRPWGRRRRRIGVPLAHSHGTDITINPGDTLCIKRGAVHSFMAHDGDVAFLAIATPGVFGPGHFRELVAHD
jgi:hypothetical protein